MSAASDGRTTAAEFVARNSNGFELRDGQVAEAGQGLLGAVVASAVRVALWTWAEKHGSWVFGHGCGWFLDGFNVRNPSAMVISKRRLPVLTDDPLFDVPELVVDVAAFYEPFAAAVHRVEGDIHRGVPLAWAIVPRERIAMILAPGNEPRWIASDGILDGGPVLPGFSLPLKTVFEGIDRQ